MVAQQEEVLMAGQSYGQLHTTLWALSPAFHSWGHIMFHLSRSHDTQSKGWDGMGWGWVSRISQKILVLPCSFTKRCSQWGLGEGISGSVSQVPKGARAGFSPQGSSVTERLEEMITELLWKEKERKEVGVQLPTQDSLKWDLTPVQFSYDSNGIS